MIRNGKQVIEDEVSPEEQEHTILLDTIRHLRFQVKALADACEAAHEEITNLAGPNDRADEGYPQTETDCVLQKIHSALIICRRRVRS